MKDNPQVTLTAGNPAHAEGVFTFSGKKRTFSVELLGEGVANVTIGHSTYYVEWEEALQEVPLGESTPCSGCGQISGQAEVWAISQITRLESPAGPVDLSGSLARKVFHVLRFWDLLDLECDSCKAQEAAGIIASLEMRSESDESVADLRKEMRERGL